MIRKKYLAILVPFIMAKKVGSDSGMPIPGVLLLIILMLLDLCFLQLQNLAGGSGTLNACPTYWSLFVPVCTLCCVQANSEWVDGWNQGRVGLGGCLCVPYFPTALLARCRAEQAQRTLEGQGAGSA